MPASYIATRSRSTSAASSTPANATRATASPGAPWRPFSPRPIAPADQERPGMGGAQGEQRDPGLEPLARPEPGEGGDHDPVAVEAGDRAPEPPAATEVDVDVDRARLLPLGDRLDHLRDRRRVGGEPLPEAPAEPTRRQDAAPPLGGEGLVGGAAAEQVAQQPVAHAPLLEVVELDRQSVGDLLALVELGDAEPVAQERPHRVQEELHQGRELEVGRWLRRQVGGRQRRRPRPGRRRRPGLPRARHGRRRTARAAGGCARRRTGAGARPARGRGRRRRCRRVRRAARRGGRRAGGAGRWSR